MLGTRVYDYGDSSALLLPGQYAKHERLGHWYGCTPNDLLAGLANHQVTEHENGTITVSPSILVTCNHVDGKQRWHGYLEAGTWRQVD